MKRSIERMLHDVGLANQQIADVLGKTRQAVGQLLRNKDEENGI